jgi:O-antigen/teichoic acid export membrane protein
VIISAFLLPRLVLTNFGSSVNGATQTINQFIGVISLLSSGVGAVTMAALYKPLAENDIIGLSAIANATQMFLKKVSKIFVLSLIILASIFPIFLIEEFDYLFSFTLVIILGIGTFSNYYFGLTYKTILNADQKQYINIIIQMLTLVFHTISSVILINCGYSILLVKLVSALIFSLNPILVYIYVHKKYKIDKTVTPNFEAIKQRWDAFVHQITNLINNNTDLIILLIFTNAREASVFSVYYLVYNGVLTLIASIITGVQSAFGNMLAKNELFLVKRSLQTFEFILHSLSIVVFVSMAKLLIPFVELYTIGITDIDYTRPLFAYIISMTGFLVAIRVPYQVLSRAAGHYRETRKGAIIEAILNIVISLSLVIPLGIVGLAIGTLVATLYRSLDFGIYISKNIVHRKLSHLTKRMIISLINCIMIILIILILDFSNYNNWYNWIINAIIITVIGTVTTVIFSVIFYKEDFIMALNIIKNLFRKKKSV